VLHCRWALALLGYAALAGGLIGLLAIGKYRMARWARRGRVVTDDRVLAVFRAAREHIGVGRDVTVVESPRVLTPITIGTFHPVVLLPAHLPGDCGDEDLSAIALHELAHVRRCDSLLLTLLSLVRGALFFHPLIWLACRQAAALAEIACDDAAVDATAQPVSYARMLARMAERLPARALATELSAGIVLSKSAFLRRVEAILSDRRAGIRRLSRLALAATLAASVLSVLLAAGLPLGQRNAEALAGGNADKGATQPAAQAAPSTSSGQAEIDRLIRQLGSEEFAEREAAQKALVEIGLPAVAALERVVHDKDQERAMRARGVLERIKQAVEAEKTAWGKAVNGLRIGLRLDEPDPPYRPGELVSLVLSAQNTGKKPLSLTDRHPLKGWTPTVRTRDGKPVLVSNPPWTGPVQVRQRDVEPGELVEVGTIFLQLDTGSESAGEDPHAYLPPGQYVVSQK